MVERSAEAQQLATTSRRVSRRRIGLILSAAGVAISSLLWLAADRAHAVQAPPNQRILYDYFVKIVCATDGTLDFRSVGATLGDTDTVLAGADLYQTAVNVFNPHDRPTGELNGFVALSHEPGGSRRRSTFTVSFPELDAIEFDCEFFKNAVHDDRVPGGTGFFVFRSPVELEVVAVYTMLEKTRCNSGARTVLPGMSAGTGCHGAGASLDVEHIRPRPVQVPN